MQRLVKNRQAGAGHQPDKQNRWDGKQAGRLVELRIVSSRMEPPTKMDLRELNEWMSQGMF